MSPLSEAQAHRATTIIGNVVSVAEGKVKVTSYVRTLKAYARK